MKTDNWAAFAEDLKTVIIAFLMLQDDAKEQLALIHYLGNWMTLRFPSINVKQRHPKTLDEAEQPWNYESHTY